MFAFLLVGGIDIAVFGVFAVLGGLLLKRGRWPSRVGRTAHCPKCDYILTGEQSRCPECGTNVGPANVVRGERHRRPIMAGFGAALILLAGLTLLDITSVAIRRIDWLAFYPLTWLLRDITNATSPAWVEVQRRIDSDLLSESEQSQVVERGLAVQNMPSKNFVAKSVLDFVAKRYLDKKLTASQADRFFANILKVKLSARTVVGAQSQVPYFVTNIGQGPWTNWWYRLRILETQIDDEPVDLSQRNSSNTAFGGVGGMWFNGTLPPVAKPGKHRMRFKVEMTTGTNGRDFGAGWDEKELVAKRVTQDLFADFEVVEGQTPVATVAAPDATVMRSFWTPRLTPNPPGSIPPVNLSLLASDPLPVDAACEVFIRCNGMEYSVGTVYAQNGNIHGTMLYVDASNFPRDLPANIDIILRSSEAAARRTVEMKRIWKGEIVLANVPIDHESGAKR